MLLGSERWASTHSRIAVTRGADFSRRTARRCVRLTQPRHALGPGGLISAPSRWGAASYYGEHAESGKREFHSPSQ